MIKRVALAMVLLCTTVFCINAQKKELKAKFGKISKEEMEMTSYADDPSAPAVILFDKGRLNYTYNDNAGGFIEEYERHVRIKIFKKEAYDLANFDIHFIEGSFTKQRITEIKAICYNNEDGKIVETKLKNESIFDESLTKQHKVKKITVPGVKEGSIVEYKYTISSEHAITFPDWTFQHLVPTVWSEFEAHIPQHYEFSKMTQGFTPYLITEEERKNKVVNITFTQREEGYTNKTQIVSVKLNYDETSMRFVQEKIPAFKQENFIGSANDYLTKIMFQIKTIYNTKVQYTGGNDYALVNLSPINIASSWEYIGKEMLTENYEEIIKSDKYTGEIARKVVEGKTEMKDKIQAIYDYIGKNYTTESRDQISMSQTLKELTTSHKGTATELNILLINMLNHAGVPSWPVLISTRDNGRVMSWYPQLSSMNRAIASVKTDNGESVLVDMTEYPQPIGLLPTEDLNNEGLLLKGADSIKWIPLQNKINTRKAILSNLTISTEGVLSGDVTVSNSGYEAVENRKIIKESNSQKYVSSLLKEIVAEGSVDEHKIENADAFYEPNIKGNFKIKTTAFVNKADNKIYISPTLCFGTRENPFKAPERQLDINMKHPLEESMTFAFKLPEGYKIDELPKGTKMSLNENAITFDYLTENKDNQVKVIIRMKLKKTQFAAAEYADLRNFYAQIVSKMGEQIVLSKI